MAKQTKGWAITDSQENFIYAAYTEAMAKALAAVVISPLRSWDELQEVGYRCIPVTITPETPTKDQP